MDMTEKIKDYDRIKQYVICFEGYFNREVFNAGTQQELDRRLVPGKDLQRL